MHLLSRKERPSFLFLVQGEFLVREGRGIILLLIFAIVFFHGDVLFPRAAGSY